MSAASKKTVSKRIIIATFVHSFRWGRQIRGDERGFIEKVKAYKSLGIEFFVLEKDPSLQDGMGEPLYTSLNLGNRIVPPKNIGQLMMLSLCALKAVVRKYPSRPIAIYAYNQDIENLWVGYVLKILVGAPLIVIYHQIWPAAFSSLRRGIAGRIRRGYHPVRAIYLSLMPFLNKFAANHADVHIALSEATKEEAKKLLGIKHCTVIGNGLDSVKFHPLDIPKTFDAAFLGRLAPQKGIDVLLHAWSEVVKGNSGSRLVLIGGGDFKDVLLYQEMVKELQLEGNVTFAGFVEDDKLVTLLNSSKLFVFPSRKEGFAQAVSQAMGCGLCCILSDIPPLLEVYGRAAAFFPVDKPSALAERVEHFLGAEDERQILAQKARQLAETFSWQDTVKRELLQLSKASGGGHATGPSPGLVSPTKSVITN